MVPNPSCIQRKKKVLLAVTKDVFLIIILCERAGKVNIGNVIRIVQN